MGRLKYNKLKEFDNDIRKEKKAKGYSKFSDKRKLAFDARTTERRNFYKERFIRNNERQRAKERIRKDYERVKASQKGKSRKQIDNLWKRYNSRKNETLYGVRVEYDSRLKRFEFPVKLNLSNFSTVYKQLSKRDNFRSLLVYLGFTTPEGGKSHYSSAYPYENLAYETLYEFTQDVIDNIPRQTSQGIVVEVVEVTYLVYYGGGTKND